MLEVFSQGLNNPIEAGSLSQLLTDILEGILIILGPIVVLVIVIIGASLLFAQGNPEKLQERKRWLLWALIGALIILSAFGLQLFITELVGNFRT